MFDAIMNFYHDLPGVIRWLIDFLFTVIFVRGVLANEILQELRQRGIFKQGILHAMKRKAEQLGVMARKFAILEHYKLGHTEGNITVCTEDKCASL